MALGYHHLLVPLDGSPLSAQALPYAQAIARQASARLTLLQVVPELAALAGQPSPAGAMLAGGPQAQALQQQWQEQAQRVLSETAQTLAQQGLQAHAEIRPGRAADGILEFAQGEGIDLVVMSTHGRTGLARWVFGSVAARVLHGVACPVLLVCPVDGAPAITPSVRRILVTLDGTGFSTQALPEAERLAHLFGAEIVLLRAIPDTYEHSLQHVPESFAAEVKTYTSGMLERLHSAAQVEQAGIAGDLTARQVKATSIVVIGDPVETILSFALSQAADLLVMATHARAGMARLLHGSVAERVLYDAPCPVLLVRGTAAN